jgi:hypothetical protein
VDGQGCNCRHDSKPIGLGKAPRDRQILGTQLRRLDND